MLLRASPVGAHVPFDFCRHKSFRLLRMETTRLRESGCSGEATAKLLPSASSALAGCASAMALVTSAVGLVFCSVRTDIVTIEVCDSLY